MKNILILLKVLVLSLLIANCAKSSIEDQEPTLANNTTSSGMPVTERDGENFNDLGPASNYGINPANYIECSGAKFKVLCVQHACQSLKSNPVDFWEVDLYYFWINPVDQHLYSGVRSVTSSGTGAGTWVYLNHPILASSEVTYWAGGHKFWGICNDGWPNAAATDLYVVFDCNTSDNLVTLHKIEAIRQFRSNCQYYDITNEPFATKTLTIGNNCSNSSSSPNSQTYAPYSVPYPCI